jgi:hypothetical protein
VPANSSSVDKRDGLRSRDRETRQWMQIV